MGHPIWWPAEEFDGASSEMRGFFAPLRMTAVRSDDRGESVSQSEDGQSLGWRLYNQGMANLTLVYGMRLLPADEVAEVADAKIALKNGNEAHVTMHVLEGSREEIEKQLKMSLDAFFDFYPEI
jgi:hypothetical protein